MKHLLKITLLSTLFLFFAASKMKAAFPTEKASANAVVINSASGINNSIVVKPATSKELKKQLRVAKHQNAKPMAGGKNKIVAALLAFFLGSFGVHSFYMGQKKKGFIQLGLSLLGIGLIIAGASSYVSGVGQTVPVTIIIGYLLLLGVAIWAFVDFIRILTGGLAPEEGFND